MEIYSSCDLLRWFFKIVFSDSGHHSIQMFTFIADDDDMTDLAEAIMEDCDGEVSKRILYS